MPEIYVTSDLHFGDNTVNKLNRSALNKNIEEMNSYLIDQWNKTVKKEDTVYVLGDLGKKEYIHLYKQLLGKKILVLGNHDVDTFGTDEKIYLENGFSEVNENSIRFGEFIEFSHEPQPINEKYRINLHGHLHNARLSYKGYYNICVDLNMYKPVNIKKFNKYTGQLKRVRKDFGKEWYFENYVFVE